MSDYARGNTGGATHFGDKDALTTGDQDKVIVGAQFDTEFNAILTAVNSKYDSADLASTTEANAETSNAVLITPSRLAFWADSQAGVVGEMQELADPGADRIFFWDDGESADSNVAWLTVGNGLEIGTTTLGIAAAAAGAGLTQSSGVLAIGAGSGLTVNADDVAITNVTAAAGQPVNISSGTFTFDMSALDALSIETLSQAQDSLLVSDNGTLKLLPVDNVGTKIVASSTKSIDSDDDVNVMYVNTSASDHTFTVVPEVTFDFPVGTEVAFLSESTGSCIVAAGAGVTINSLASYLTVKASGGGAYLVKTGTNIWTLVGDIEA